MPFFVGILRFLSLREKNPPNFCGRAVSRMVSIIGRDVAPADLFLVVELFGRGVHP